jgi:hypothetical protein
MAGFLYDSQLSGEPVRLSIVFSLGWMRPPVDRSEIKNGFEIEKFERWFGESRVNYRNLCIDIVH